jgi:cytochrome bd-type quinol oxidase subunit 2
MATTTTTTAPSAKTRHWSDFVAILVGVALIGIEVWPGDQNASSAAAQDLGNPKWILIAHITAGALALASVFLAQRRERSGLPKMLLLLAGALLLGGFILSIATGDSGTRAWLTLVLPGVLLLGAAFGVGPMPRDLHSR